MNFSTNIDTIFEIHDPKKLKFLRSFLICLIFDGSVTRVFTKYQDTDIECSPSKLKKWFNSDDPLNSDSVMAFKLVDITLNLLNLS